MNKLSIVVRYGQMFAEKTMKEYEIGFPEQIILMYLAKSDEMNQDSIARHYKIDKGAIAKTVAKLEGKELILRRQNPDNKRENLLSLSEEGTNLIRIMKEKRKEWDEKLYQGLEKSQIQLLEKITDQMMDNLLEQDINIK